MSKHSMTPATPKPASPPSSSNATLFFVFYDENHVFIPLNAGDFDEGGSNDKMDAAMLGVAIQGNYGNRTAAHFDLNGSGTVTSADMDVLLSTYLNTVRGAANLDA